MGHPFYRQPISALLLGFLAVLIPGTIVDYVLATVLTEAAAVWDREVPIVDFIEKGDYRFFVRHSDIDPQHIKLAQSLKKRLYGIRRHVPSLVGAVDAQMVESRLLEHRRDGVADGVADYT